MDEYRITRVLNNNAAISTCDGVDMLLLGPSIGFGRHVGDLIPGELVERSYILRDAAVYQKLEELFQRIPTDLIAFCMELIAYFKAAMEVPLSDNLYISLPDHIYTALEMYRQGIKLDNMMRWEIKSFFGCEFDLGMFAVEEINRRYQVEMGEDEASFIALHIINAASDTPTPIAMEITRFITYVVEGLERLLAVTLDTESLAYLRFVMHVKYLGKRIVAGEGTQRGDDDSDELLHMVEGRYQRAHQCAERLFRDIEAAYGYHASSSERLYLTIHIHKLINEILPQAGGGGDATA